MDQASSAFRYEACQDEFWNPEKFSLLYGTPLWDQSTHAQRVKLNQIYWVAYYCQIISAEIATIFFNQVSAAGLYALEDFRIVCDTLDLESAQERAHIHAFKKISEDFESQVFGERLFTYPMRGPYVETMIHKNSNQVQEFWRMIQLKAFTLLSSGNAFLGCQYFTVRGVRTLNGKLVQHQLSQFYAKHPDQQAASIPSKISYYHFQDESFHFNTSLMVSLDVVNSLKNPTVFESFVSNRGLEGTQKDHYHFSTAINGLFWHDPALYQKIYRILRSPIFAMDDAEACEMMKTCFTRESEGMHASFQTRNLAMHSYKEYLSKLKHINRTNREMSIMGKNSLQKHLRDNQRQMNRFVRDLSRMDFIRNSVPHPGSFGESMASADPVALS